ncbi:Rho GTPase-activating protein 17 [Sparganum proliferum]
MLEDPFGEIEDQQSAGGFDSACAKEVHGVDNSQYTPRLVPTTELGRRAQRCRNEFTRQGRVFRSLPQRLKVKHSTVSAPSTPRSLPNWQAIFTGRPQSSQTSAFISSSGNKSQQSPRSTPVTGPSRRSLTPVFNASERLRNNAVHPTGTARGSLPDTNAHTVTQNRLNIALTASEVLSSTDATDDSIQPRLPGGWSEGENVNTSSAGRTTSEDSNWKQPASRYGVYYGDSLSLDSHLTLEEVEAQREPSQCEDRTQKSFPHPRSDLQRRYQEWRRAMLDSSEQTEPPGSRFFHGDLYDTLFTLQTLNNVSGLEDFLTRVRSVYEARTSIKKPTTGDAGVAGFVPCSSQVAYDALQNITATPGSTSENASHATRRHSISSAASNELVDTALPRPINPAVQRHYRKSLTSPSCMKPHRVSIPLSPELDKRPASSLSRMETSEEQRLLTDQASQKFTSQLTKNSRSSCAARLGLDASPIGSTLESRDRCFKAEKDGSNRLLETMAQTSVRTSNTLPRTSADSSDVALTARIILPLANDDMSSNFAIGRQAKQTSPTAASTVAKIQSTAASLPSLNPKSRVRDDPVKKRTSCTESTATSTFPSNIPI